MEGRDMKYCVGEDVRVEFIGKIIEIKLHNGQVVYTVDDEKGGRVILLPESFLSKLPQPTTVTI
jgi:hypothetical protein